MELTLGARLRAQREQHQISLAAIAAATKIKLSLLEGLEADEVSRWPKGIFGRAYLRDYARAIGCDGDEIIREFYELHPDPVVPLTSTQLTADASGEPPPDNTFRRLVLSAMGAVPGLLQRPSRPSANGTRVEELQPIDELPSPPIVIAASTIEETQTDGSMAMTIEEAVLDGMMPSPPVYATEKAPPVVESVAVADDDRPSLSAIAEVCTRLARVVDLGDVRRVLGDAARLLDAVGVIVWAFDPHTGVLAPSVAHGYSDALLARLPRVRTDAPNAIAAAFRSGEASVVEAEGDGTGAVAVPVLTSAGCAGVFALELRGRVECCEWARPLAAIIAAQLAPLFDQATLADAAAVNA